MNKKVSHIFSPTSCPEEKELLDYVKGRSSPLRKHVIEAHLADCEMCNDFVEGLSLLSDPDNFSQIVEGLNRDIDLAASKKSKTRFLKPRIILSAAAVLATIVAVTFVLQNQLKKETGTQKTAYINHDEATSETEMAPSEEMTDETSGETIRGGKNAPPLTTEQAQEDSPTYYTRVSGGSAVTSDSKTVSPYYDLTIIDETDDDLVLAEIISDGENNRNIEADKFETEEETTKTTETTVMYSTTGGVVEKDESSSKNRTAKESGKKDTARTESQAPAASGDQPDEGIALYESGQYQLSLKYFESLLQHSPEDQRAQWYYALNLIRLNRTEEAKALLQTIINRDGDYKKSAEKELKKL